MIGKHLKEYRKWIEKERIRESGKGKISKNSEWKKRWIPFIKYDQDFDSSFFLELITYKLHMLLDFHKNNKNYSSCEEHLNIIESLEKACILGDRLLIDADREYASDFHKQHAHMVIKEVEPGYFKFTYCWDDPKNEEEFTRLMEWANREREKTKQQFFKYLADHYEEWRD